MPHAYHKIYNNSKESELSCNMKYDIFVYIVAAETGSIIFIHGWTRNANNIKKNTH